jgi:hypothetical protein
VEISAWFQVGVAAKRFFGFAGAYEKAKLRSGRSSDAVAFEKAKQRSSNKAAGFKKSGAARWA